MRRSDTYNVTKNIGFNPRICKRCDVAHGNYRFQFLVSIHASVKDATVWIAARDNQNEVSIHASVKDATRLQSLIELARKVSIHASVKDATDYFFYPNTKIKVSIHASVKDATMDVGYIIPTNSVSIHASVKDATAEFTNHNTTIGFNPRICKRCDPRPQPGNGTNRFQSTHL